MTKTRAAKIDEFISSVQERSKQRVANHSKRSDISWDSFTPESQEVLEYFGLDAPYLLNEYTCKVEDALIETVARLKAANELIGNLQEQLNQQAK